MQNKTDVLQNCTIEGNVVFLPEGQLDRKLYVEVAKTLEILGGKWNKREKGFLFEENPAELLDSAIQGTPINAKKEYQFFPTPKELAYRLVALAEIEAGMTILEPSAGRGSIIEALLDKAKHSIWAYELMPLNFAYLQRKYDNKVILGQGDFLDNALLFDRIVANPPFSKNRDIKHIRKMYESLVEGGKLVSICSTHYLNCDNREEKEFRKFLSDTNAVVTPVEVGAFKASGTLIPTVIIEIWKHSI